MCCTFEHNCRTVSCEGNAKIIYRLRLIFLLGYFYTYKTVLYPRIAVERQFLYLSFESFSQYALIEFHLVSIYV